MGFRVRVRDWWDLGLGLLLTYNFQIPGLISSLALTLHHHFISFSAALSACYKPQNHYLCGNCQLLDIWRPLCQILGNHHYHHNPPPLRVTYMSFLSWFIENGSVGHHHGLHYKETLSCGEQQTLPRYHHQFHSRLVVPWRIIYHYSRVVMCGDGAFKLLFTAVVRISKLCSSILPCIVIVTTSH